LLGLKAKALLPQPAHAEGDAEDEVERDLLIARLLEVQTFRTAGEHLASMVAVGDRRFPSKPAADDEALRRFPVLADIVAADLGRTVVGVVLESLRTVDTSKVVVDQVSTQEAAVELVGRLEGGPLIFSDLARGRNLAWSVALFLAMLELAMRGEIELGAGMTVGDLELRLTRRI
jgi:chromatin segregation and condensation protein Rec8/ScpA/Scc1 (kleisin family)